MPEASTGDLRKTDSAALIQLVEPGGHKLIMDFFVYENLRYTTS